MKRMIGGLFFLSLIVMSSPSAASDKPFSFSIGGGIATPVGGAGESLGSGGQVTIGVGVKVQPKLTVFGEYNFSSLGQKSLDIPQPKVDAPATFSGSGWYQVPAAAASPSRRGSPGRPAFTCSAAPVSTTAPCT